MKLHTRIQHIISAELWSLTLGVCLFVSPFLLNFNEGQIIINTFVVGFIIVAIASIRALIPSRIEFLSWLNIVVALWLFISPFILGYSSVVATLEAVVLGLAISVVEFYSVTETHVLRI